MKASEKLLSIVVPLRNEEGNVEKLHKEIFDSARQHNLSIELILVNDASTDRTLQIAKKLHPVRIINFRGWFGQTAAMDAGIKAARGEIVITMDGDLQNDPQDIPRLLEKMDEGFDVVSGWRKNRRDPFSKKFLSRGADKLRKILVNDRINDSGCTLKAFKKECFKGVDLYGEMHRFIPALLKVKGYSIAEVVVNHRERVAGQTKYNWKRLMKGLLDLTSVWFWRKFSNRPLHLFGGLGFSMSFVGSILLVWMAFEKVFFRTPLSNRIWPLMGIFLIILGFQFIVSGLLADILIKTYYQTKNEKNYSIKEIIENE